jgi:hypothetical protein
MSYYEKRGHWPFLKAKKNATTSSSEEEVGVYVPEASHFGVVDEKKATVTESVLEAGQQMSPAIELVESQA